MSDTRCADVSAAAGEALAGTAVTVENWLLVEVRGTWPRDVSDALDHDGPLSAWLAVMPAPRILFIRRPRVATGPHVAFAVRSTESKSWVRRMSFDVLTDLDPDGGKPFDEPLVLVCGHGTRDACCALRGNAVYAALGRDVSSDALWISSHQGGHRFAANVLVLPDGIQLGRVSTHDVSVVDEACRGRISLPHYRGRTTYAPHVQAAEAAVRAAVGLVGVRDLRLVADDDARVLFETGDGRSFTVAVDEAVGPAVPASCGVAPEPQRAFSTRLV